MRVLRYLFAVAAVVLFISASNAQEVSLQKVKINNDLRLELPEDFVPMTEQDIAAGRAVGAVEESAASTHPHDRAAVTARDQEQALTGGGGAVVAGPTGRLILV